jgi:signal transduction histidine kinase
MQHHKSHPLKRFLSQLSILFTCISISWIASCAPSDKKIPPKAIKGVLDLRDWDFQKDGNINLDGEWEFYWKEFPVGEELALPEEKRDYIDVPRFWNGKVVKRITENGEKIEETLEREGYATYRLKVLMKHKLALGFRISAQLSSYQIFMNKVLLQEAGIVGSSLETSQGDRSIHYSFMNLDKEEIEILVKISNFQFSRGGFKESIKIGIQESIYSLRDYSLALDLFILGILFIMGIYHLALFYLRREDRSPLYFGIFCLTIFLRTGITGERYLQSLVPSLGFSLGYSLDYLTMYVAAPTFLEFIRNIFPSEANKKVIRVLQSICILFCILVITLSPVYFGNTLSPYQSILLIIIINIIYLLFKAILNKRQGAWFFLFGFFIFTISIINDILYVRNIINTGLYVPAGLVAFIFSQSYLLSARFSKAFSDAKEARLMAEEQRQLVQTAKEEIERLGRAKDEFLANLSHEIKTPLVTIYGYSELLTMEEGLPESIKEYGIEIYSSAGRLNSYMDDVLLVTDLETNLQIDKKPHSLSTLVGNALRPLDSLIQEKKVQIQIPDLSSTTILCDAILFERALSNVFKNAIVYNKVGGNVKLEVRQVGTFQEISIRDTGIGIEPEYYGKIFEKFFRVDSSLSYEVSGVGLGLFLAKRIVDLHDGSIGVGSEIGKGSEFVLTLPII